MKSFNLKYIKGDLFGGVTAGVVALPLALAFGVQSGMGAIAGLYGAMILGILAAFFGGTNTQVSGPTGPMTVISASVIAMAIETSGSLAAGMGIIIASFAIGGLIQIVLGLIRTGKYVKYIPYPVLSGFMSGIGIIIILFQIYPFMGHPSAKSTIDIFLEIGMPLSNMNLEAVGLAVFTILVIYLFPKITKAVPSTLIALILSTIISIFMGLQVPLIGDIPAGLPELKLDQIFSIDPAHYWTILEFAMMLAALGAIDSLLTSVIADNITKTKHKSDRELIGQGIGNTVSAIFGGLPGAGATMRTVVNINAGGKTKLSGMVHGLFLLVVLLGAGQYAAKIPLSVLSGILITVGIGIIDYKGFKHLLRVPRADAVILLTVLAITVFGNLLHAVGVGVVLACVLFMKKSSDLAEAGTSVNAMVNFDNEGPWDDESGVYNKYKDKIYIKHLYGPLFFGFTSRFQELIKDLENIKVLVIRMDRVPYIDQSGVYAMEENILRLQNDGILVALTAIQPQPKDMLKKIGIVPDLVPEEHLFETFEDCAKWMNKAINDKSNTLENIVVQHQNSRKAR